MKYKFFAVVLFVLIICNSAFALSDPDYKQMMKDANFAKADKELSRAWKEALNITAKSKPATEKLRQSQLEWVKHGRDEEAEALMDKYSRIRAYTIVTRVRAEDLPNIAREFLNDTRSSSQKRTSSTSTETSRYAEGYPTLGTCTGNGVRIRDNPGTNSKVIGGANDGQILILLGEKNLNGDTWYKIDNPDDTGSAWIIGKYIEPYEGDESGRPAFDLAMKIRMNFGLKPEKARAVFGEPVRISKDSFYSELSGEEYEQITYDYSGFKLQYVANRLRHVEVSIPGRAFGTLQIGDSEQKILHSLGKPDGRGEEGCTYDVSPRESIQFEINNGRITLMLWDEYIDA